MTGPLIFLIISIILFLIACYASVETNAPYCIPAIIPVVLAVLTCELNPVKTVYEPVPYTVESTSFKVFAITDKKVFDSDKKIDFHNWTLGKEGYICTTYSTFGTVVGETFTTEKTNNEK